MANSYLYIHKMAKAHEDAKRELRRMIGRGLPNCVKEEIKAVLDILEKPDKEEKK